MVDLYGERFSVSVSDMAEKQAATIWEVKNWQVPEGLSPETSLWGGGRWARHWGQPLCHWWALAEVASAEKVVSLETGLWGQAPT